MKTILLTMTALGALAVAAPAAAQSHSGHMSHTASLQMQLDAGMRSGAISRREATPLRSSLRNLVGLEHRFGRNGFTQRENAMLSQRSHQLSRQISFAARDGNWSGRGGDWNGRSEDSNGHGGDWNGRGEDSNGHGDDWNGHNGRSDGKDGTSDRREAYGIDPRFEQPNRGDRFAGDAEVGHRATARMIALPEQYRDSFRDDAEVYYRYDAGRIFRISRSTDMVLGLFDIRN